MASNESLHMPQTKAVKEGEPNLAGDHIREGLAAVPEQQP